MFFATQIHHVQPPAVGDTITFQLLRRPKGSIISLPVGAGQSTDTAAAAAALQDTASSSSGAPAGPAADAGAAPCSLDSIGSSSSGSALAASKWTARKAAAAGAAAGAPAAAGAAASAGAVGAAAAVKAAVAYSSVSTPLLENLFAKFATLPDPRALWRAAARELGQQLAEVLAQGGLEAGFEAPGLFAAADCLAQRARRFAEHQATQLQQRGVPVGAAPAVPPGGGAAAGAAAAAGWPVWLAADPQAAGQEADALIRDAFTLAIDSGKAALTAAEQEQAVAAEFPSLAATAGSPPASQAGAGSRPPPGGLGLVAAGSSPPSGASLPSAAKASGGAAPAAPPAAQQQQQPVQAPATPECTAAAIERQSSRTEELFFDHTFSEDEEEEEQQQQEAAAGQGEEPPAPQLAPEDSGSAGGGGPVHSSARSIPGQAGVADGSGGAAAGLFGTSPGTSGLLGSSPTTSAMNSASLSEMDYFMYQAADGQWLFLHPLNLRCLLHAFGSYAACPPTVTGRVVELEDMTQDEGSRCVCVHMLVAVVGCNTFMQKHIQESMVTLSWGKGGPSMYTPASNLLGISRAAEKCSTAHASSCVEGPSLERPVSCQLKAQLSQVFLHAQLLLCWLPTVFMCVCLLAGAAGSSLATCPSTAPSDSGKSHSHSQPSHLYSWPPWQKSSQQGRSAGGAGWRQHGGKVGARLLLQLLLPRPGRGRQQLSCGQCLASGRVSARQQRTRQQQTRPWQQQQLRGRCLRSCRA